MILRFIAKHLTRLKNTIRRRLKIMSLKLQYGNQFQAAKFHFRSNFHVFIEEQGIVKIKNNVFFNNNCSITARLKIIIGNDCIFGENVKIYDHNHIYKDTMCLIRKQGFISNEVIIEDNCWIGSNVTILKGVHIGRHSVVGAGVVVYKDLPENSVIVCNQNLINLGEQ